MTALDHILIVDDNEAFADSLVDTFELEGFDVSVALTGEQALSLMRSGNEFGLALVDIHLPDMSGEELVSLLHDLCPKTEFIIITGNATLQSAVNAVNRPRIVGYEVKPVDTERLLTLCREIFARRQAQKKAILYQNIIQNIQVGIHVYHLEDLEDDRTFRFVTGNPAAEQFTGLRTLDLIGKTMDENFPALRAMGLVAGYADVVRTGIAREMGEVHYSDGHIPGEWFLVKAFPLPGQRLGAAFENITARKNMEADLEQQRHYLQTVTSGMGAGLALIDPAHTVLWTNDIAQKTLGFRAGEKCYVTHSRRNSCPHCLVQHIWLGHKDKVTFEETGLDEHGNPCFTQIHATPIRDDTGHVDSALCLLVPITERKLVEQALRRSEQELRALSRKIIALQEEERARLARELHDELGQQLTALRWGLERLQNQVPDTAAQEQLAKLTQMLTGATRDLRGICKGLRPPILDDLGLDLALEALVDDFRVSVDYDVEITSQNLSGIDIGPEKSIVVYRVLQEALTNAARHARAAHVRVTLKTDGGDLLLEIADDGRGMTQDAPAPDSGLGIPGMRERAALCGGALHVESGPERGTVITLRIPLNNPGEDSLP